MARFVRLGFYDPWARFATMGYLEAMATTKSLMGASDTSFFLARFGGGGISKGFHLMVSLPAFAGVLEGWAYMVSTLGTVPCAAVSHRKSLHICGRFS